MKLKELREKKGLSQRDLADMTEISVRTIQSYEQGVRDLNKANIKIIQALCRELDCNIEDLLKI